MREIRSSGSVEGVASNHDSYSDFSSIADRTSCRVRDWRSAHRYLPLNLDTSRIQSPRGVLNPSRGQSAGLVLPPNRITRAANRHRWRCMAIQSKQASMSSWLYRRLTFPYEKWCNFPLNREHWLPDKRHEAESYFVAFPVAGEVTEEQVLFVEKTDHDNGDHECEGDQPPPGRGGKRGTKQHNQGTAVHGMANERVRACRDDGLLLGNFDSGCCERIDTKYPEDDIRSLARRVDRP